MKRLGLIGLVLLLCSCTLPPTVLPPPPEEVTAKDLLEELRRREDSLFSLRGLAHISWREGKRLSLKSRQALLIRKPDRFRSELFGLFGQPELVAAVNDREVTALALAEGLFYRGRASAENIHRLLHLPLAPADLLRLALNQAPQGDFPDRPLIVATAEGYRLTRSGREWKQDLHFRRDRR